MGDIQNTIMKFYFKLFFASILLVSEVLSMPKILTKKNTVEGSEIESLKEEAGDQPRKMDFVKKRSRYG